MLSAASEPFETDKCGSNVRFLGFRAIFPDVKDVPECTVAAGAVPCDKLQLRFIIICLSSQFQNNDNRVIFIKFYIKIKI